MLGVWIFLYLAIQFGVCYWISKKITSETDYFLAGRSLPLFLVSVSLFATWFGAETCIGSAGAVYKEGLSGSRADPFGYSFCLFFMGLFLASRLWKGNYITLADLFRERYGVRVERLAVWIFLPSSLVWGAAQIRAFGQVLAATTDFPITITITFAACFVVAYTFLGGLLGDIITDLIQGIILAIGLLLILVFAFNNSDGLSQYISALPTERLSFIAPGESFLERMDRWMIPILGSLVAQELISRILASKSSSIARNSSYVACGIYLFFGSIPVILGLLGPHFLPGVEDQEQFLSLLAQKYLPPFMYVIFSGALLSAILSTIDSIFLAISALVSHNIIVPQLKNKTEKIKILSARIVVVFAGLISYVIALYSDGIYSLVEFASTLGTPGILIITFFGLYTKMGNSLTATITLVAGILLTPLYERILKLEAPFLFSVTSSLVIFIAFHFLEKKYKKIPIRI